MGEGTLRRADLVAALRRAVFESDGATDVATRRAAGIGGDALRNPWDGYAEKVRDASYRITDADIDALRAAGCSEEEIFEVTVAAATGAALRRFDAGLRALRGDGA